MINILLVWMSLPVMAQGVVDPGAVLEKVAPIVSPVVPFRELIRTTSVPRPPRPVLVEQRFAGNSGGPLITEELWRSLGAPNQAIRNWVLSRVPGLDISQVHAISFSALDPIVAAAVAAGYNDVNFLTDNGLTTPHIFYISRGVAKTLFTKYDFAAITVDSGVSKDGKPFQIQAMLIGDKKTQVLYNQDKFEFTNPNYPKYPFILGSIVTYSIQGPDDLGVDGITVHAMVDMPISDIEDAHNGYLQIDMPLYQDMEKATPITLRPGQN